MLSDFTLKDNGDALRKKLLSEFFQFRGFVLRKGIQFTFIEALSACNCMIGKNVRRIMSEICKIV